MKTIDEFLSYLSDLEVKLWRDGDHLRYTAPVGAITPTLRAQLLERKAEILNFMRQADSFTLYTIRPAPRDGDLPLSFAQQRLWFLDQLEGHSAAYNIPGALRLEGQLDIDTLAQSLAQIVRRHEALRTRFPTVEGVAVQVIAPALDISLPVVDLQGLAEAVQAGEVQRLAAEAAQRPFDLAQGPLLRVSVLKLASEAHVVLLTMHHIVSDGWSIGVFIQELSALYQAFSTGAPSPLSALPIQYAAATAHSRHIESAGN